MQTNGAMTTMLYERVDSKRVAQAIKSPDIPQEYRDTLKKYAKKWCKTHNGYRVEYKHKGLQYGRLYAEKGLSLQSFKKEVRETLVHDTHTDVDIKNAHPVLLAQYCEKAGLACPALNDYVSNRDSRIQEIITRYECSRSTAKDFIICLMYLGDITQKQQEFGFDITAGTPEWVEQFAQEIKRISKQVTSTETSVFADVKKLRTREFKNPDAQTVAYVLQKIENDIISNTCTKLRQLDFEVDALCFDGVLVQGDKVDQDILEELASYAHQTTGYKVEFAIKPMKPHFSLAEEAYDYSDYEFKCLDRWNISYFDSLAGDTQEETYAFRKAYFEKHFCMIECPAPMYIRQDEGEGRQAYIMNGNEMSALLKAADSGFTDSIGRKRFWNVWEEDCKKRSYYKQDFLPYNPERPIENSDVFNTFGGFNPACFGESMESSFVIKKIRPYMDLVHEICGGTEENAEYFHRFIADIFQNPAEKPPVAICIKSKEGVGKNVILDTIGRLLDEKHYITSSEPTDFFGDHAEGFKGKLLVNLNEAEGKKTFDFEGRMKSFITETKITINPKCVRPYEMNNYARTIITTNKATPIQIDVKAGDRRYVVLKSTEKTLKYDRSFWTRCIDHFKQPEFMRALYQYYTESIDNTNFDWAKERPITDEYRKMCDKFQPIEVLYLADYIENEQWKQCGIEKDRDEMIDIGTMDLFNDYEEFKKNNRFTRTDGSATSTRAFNSRLEELDLPIDKHKSMGKMFYRMCPKSVYEAMENRTMINSWKIDLAEQKAARQREAVSVADDYFV